MAGRVLPAISGPAAKSVGADFTHGSAGWVAELRTDMDRALWNQGVGIVAAGAARRFLAVRGGNAAFLMRPARALRPNRPPASSLAAFEPPLHFVDFVQYPAFPTMRNRASNSLTTGTFRLDLSA